MPTCVLTAASVSGRGPANQAGEKVLGTEPSPLQPERLAGLGLGTVGDALWRTPPPAPSPLPQASSTVSGNTSPRAQRWECQGGRQDRTKRQHPQTESPPPVSGWRVLACVGPRMVGKSPRRCGLWETTWFRTSWGLREGPSFSTWPAGQPTLKEAGAAIPCLPF